MYALMRRARALWQGVVLCNGTNLIILDGRRSALGCRVGPTQRADPLAQIPLSLLAI